MIEYNMSDLRGINLLNEPVGYKQKNYKDDVITVQKLLNNVIKKKILKNHKKLVVDGIFGTKTLNAIYDFQADILSYSAPDAIVDPDQKTVRALCQQIDRDDFQTILSLTMLAASEEKVAQFAAPIQACFRKFSIDSIIAQCHFLAQIGHESGELRFQEEIASGRAYEGRADLGNHHAGDGVKFKGRGLIQLTGRYNYEAFSKYIKADYIMDNPAIVAEDEALCVEVAGWFWQKNNLCHHASNDDFIRITKIINGGRNGIDHRRKLLRRAKALYGVF